MAPGTSLSPSLSASSCLLWLPMVAALQGSQDCSEDKYLLSSYYVPGAAEMAENKMDTEPACVEPHASRGGGRYFISRDKCVLLCVGAG